MLQIALAEDNDGDVLLVKLALEKHNVQHCLHVLSDGAEAVRAVKNMGRPGEMPCPDVLLLDLNLPKVDGPQVLSEFRRNPQCASIPVIVVSSSDMLKDRNRMDALGISRYFRKPSEFDRFMELGEVVKQVIGQQRPPEAGIDRRPHH